MQKRCGAFNVKQLFKIKMVLLCDSTIKRTELIYLPFIGTIKPTVFLACRTAYVTMHHVFSISALLTLEGTLSHCLAC